MADKATESTALAPVNVAIISTGAVAGGSAPMESGTVATTAAPHQPNLVIQIVSPVVAISVRFVNNYLTILVGLVAAGMTSDVIPSKDFIDLVVRCAGLSIAGAGLGALKDAVTIFGRLETRFPLSTGNV